jgi:hypothetical protein
VFEAIATMEEIFRKRGIYAPVTFYRVKRMANSGQKRS